MTISTVKNLPASSEVRGRPKGEVWSAVMSAEVGNWVMVTDLPYPHSLGAYYKRTYGFEVRVVEGTLYVRKGE